MPTCIKHHRNYAKWNICWQASNLWHLMPEPRFRLINSLQYHSGHFFHFMLLFDLQKKRAHICKESLYAINTIQKIKQCIFFYRIECVEYHYSFYNMDAVCNFVSIWMCVFSNFIKLTRIMVLNGMLLFRCVSVFDGHYFGWFASHGAMVLSLLPPHMMFHIHKYHALFFGIVKAFMDDSTNASFLCSLNFVFCRFRFGMKKKSGALKATDDC